MNEETKKKLIKIGVYLFILCAGIIWYFMILYVDANTPVELKTVEFKVFMALVVGFILGFYLHRWYKEDLND